MALPEMDADPTALRSASHLQPITTTTCVHVALAHLRNSGDSAAIVYRSARPVGIVTADALARAAGAGRADAPITTAMDYVAVPVDRHADAHATARAFADAAWDWLRGRSMDSQAVRNRVDGTPTWRR